MQTTSPLSLMLLMLLLAGCFGGTTGQIEPAYYDIPVNFSKASVLSGSGNKPSNQAAVLAVRQVKVQAPVWLNSPAMQYRLLYADTERRLSFTESRWVAPPADMLELALKRRNSPLENRLEAEGCRLHVDLDEFIQVFDLPDSSRALVELRASLVSSRNGKLMAHRRFIQASSAGNDAKSGVAAFVVALRSVSTDIDEWLAQMALASPSVSEHCRLTGFN